MQRCPELSGHIRRVYGVGWGGEEGCGEEGAWVEGGGVWGGEVGGQGQGGGELGASQAQEPGPLPVPGGCCVSTKPGCVTRSLSF